MDEDVIKALEYKEAGQDALMNAVFEIPKVRLDIYELMQDLFEVSDKIQIDSIKRSVERTSAIMRHVK